MKKLALVIGSLSMAFAITATAQSKITVQNSGTTSPVYLNDVDASTRTKLPKAQAASYTATFFYGTSASSLNPIGTYKTGSSLFDGQLNAWAQQTLSDIAPSTSIYVQVRAWSTALGATWAEVVSHLAAYPPSDATHPLVTAAPYAGLYFGVSGVANVTTVAISSPTTPNIFGTGAGQIGGFDIYKTVVPEPTTAALAGLGLAGLLIFRRRK